MDSMWFVCVGGVFCFFVCLFVCVRERQNMKLGGGGIKEELVKGKDMIKIEYMKNVKSKIKLKNKKC